MWLSGLRVSVWRRLPAVVASLASLVKHRSILRGITFLVDGKRSMLLTNKLVLQTPGQRWQTLYLLDENQISSSGREIRFPG